MVVCFERGQLDAWDVFRHPGLFDCTDFPGTGLYHSSSPGFSWGIVRRRRHRQVVGGGHGGVDMQHLENRRRVETSRVFVQVATITE